MKRLKFFFWLQIICMVLFCLFLILQSKQGRLTSLSWLVSWVIFLVIMLSLALQTKETLIITMYYLWICGLCVVLFFIAYYHTLIITSADLWCLVCVTVMCVTAFKHKVGTAEFKRNFAIAMKATPQAFIAFSVLHKHTLLVAWGSIMAGHITICVRLGQLFFQAKQNEWEKNIKATFVAELCNEGSWLLVTFAQLALYIS